MNEVQKAQKSSIILRTRVDSTSINRVLDEITLKIKAEVKFYITTPNPEILLEAQKNEALRAAINNSDFAIPDGVGLRLAGMKRIIKGRDLFYALLQFANDNDLKVFLLGSTSEVNKKLISRMSKKFPHVVFKGASGPKLNNFGEPDTDKDITIQKDIYEKINKFKPQLLFVAFGAPKQELWIVKNLNKLNIYGAMVVGGTFDYFAGTKPLPPKIFDKLGLEWLWRLTHEPGHIKRVYRALILFPLQLLYSK